MLKRLNPLDIKKVYKKTGWVPAWGDYATFADGWACPSAVLLVYKKIDLDKVKGKEEEKLSELYGIDRWYFRGLEYGFSEQFPWFNDENFLNGYEDGMELLKLVKDQMKDMPDMKEGFRGEDLK
jgi:hypothetical protein